MELRKLAKKAMTTLFLSMFCLVAFAQNQTIAGSVKDELGEPMIGVSVQVVGTTTGSITDLDGNFSLQAPADGKIQVSFIGYVTQVIDVKGQQRIDVTMAEDAANLDEVVVIGYGTVKRRDLTGSVASVSGDKLLANPVANVAQALQGQLPGVSVTSQDGRPGAGMSIRIRGGGSITQSNDPLFIVDGVQVSSIDDIAADNIESIDVLKDAASTAIYGARGANGVILVTTKGAKEGRATVKYNAYYQIKENPEKLEVLDAYDYVFSTWAYATAYGETYGKGAAKYFGLGSANGNHLNEYKNVSSHNYVDDIMRTAGTWSHDLSLSGGNDKTKYYASVNYMDDEGIRINSGYSRWNANIKVDQKISEKLSFNADVRYTETQIVGTRFDMATSAFGFRPIDNPLGDPEHTAGLGQGSPNVELDQSPLAAIQNSDRIAKIHRINARGDLTWYVLKGLMAKTELSLGRNWNETKEWNGYYIGNPVSSAKLNKKDGYNVRWATTLNYEVQGLGDDHSLSFLAGNEVLSSKQNETLIEGYDYPYEFTMDDAFGMIHMTNMHKDHGKDIFKNTIGTPSHTTSWFGRANYSWQGRYLLTATFRADGSSKFAPSHHWGYFPAGAAAWRISDEAFMESSRNWLDNLKLRLSLGTSGADNIDPSLWRETWLSETIAVDGKQVPIFRPGDMQGNPDLKWETTVSRNVGLDFAFLKSKIRGSIDAYWNTTKDILMKVPVDASAGYSYQFQNVAQTSNKGIELALGVDFVRTKDFNLGLNMTYNYNLNNVDKLNDKALADTNTNWGSSMRRPTYDYIIREGQPVGTIQGFQSNGFYTVDDFNYDAATGVYTLKDGIPDIQTIVNYPTDAAKAFKIPAGQTAFPGVVKFADTDGSGTVDDDDKTIIGRAMPKHTGGFTFNGNWKGLDFSAGFTYQIGGDIYNANAMHSMMGNKDNNLGANRLSLVNDCYRIYDIDTNGDLFVVTDPDALNAMNKNAKHALNYSEYGITTSEFIEDASYLRLQNLTVGYTLPTSLTRKVGVQNLRFYFTGSNLFCITGYSGLDPDVNTRPDANGFPTPNYDYNAYPKARTYTFGLNLTF